MFNMTYSIKRFLATNVFQYFAAITGSLGMLSSEMHYGWTSPSLPILESGRYKFKITKEEGSWLVIVLLIGTIIGALMIGQVGMMIGRKSIILVSTFPTIISWLVIGFSKSVIELYIARFLGGISVGISFSIVPMYLGEIAEPKIRGMLTSMCPIFIVTGLLVINVLGNYMDIDAVAFVSAIIPVISFILFSYMPESPLYLLLTDRPVEARKSLHVLQGQENGDREYLRLEHELKTREPEQGMLSLFIDKQNRKCLIIALGLRTMQQLCGMTSITFFCKSIFEESENFISANTGTVIYFTLQVFVAAVSSLIIDIFGRKPLLVISVLGTCLTLTSTGTYFFLKNELKFSLDYIHWLPIISLFTYVIFFNIGLRTVPLSMVGEIFPPSIKSAGCSFAAIYFSILSILISKFFHVTIVYFGMYVGFYTFASTSILSLYFIFLAVPETKGKTLEDIQRELKGDEVREDTYTQTTVV